MNVFMGVMGVWDLGILGFPETPNSLRWVLGLGGLGNFQNKVVIAHCTPHHNYLVQKGF